MEQPKTALFGLSHAAIQAVQHPPIPEEGAALARLVLRTGPYADKQLLLQHLRASRGKLTWAANSYFREVLSKPAAAREDFDSRPRWAAANAAAAAAHDAAPPAPALPPADAGADVAPPAVQLDGLPGSVLEAVLAGLDVASLAAASQACRGLRRAAQAEPLWRRLFCDRWGCAIFPVAEQHGGDGTAAAAAAAAAAARLACGQVRACHDGGGNSSSSSGRMLSGWAASGSRSRSSPPGAAGTHGSSNRPQQQHPQQAQPQAQAQAQPQPQPQVAAAHAVPDACGCGCGALLPATAPAGSWRRQYERQQAYQTTRRCPQCGEGVVVPVVYGFPSSPLLQGMQVNKRLILGGDHLIDDAYVWACVGGGCRSCFRVWPYVRPALWLAEARQQQQQQQRGSGGAGGGDEGPPRYTYES